MKARLTRCAQTRPWFWNADRAEILYKGSHPTEDVGDLQLCKNSLMCNSLSREMDIITDLLSCGGGGVKVKNTSPFAAHSSPPPLDPSLQILVARNREGVEGVHCCTLLWCSGNVTDLLASVSQRGITNPGLPNGILWDHSGVPWYHVCPELMPPALPWKIPVKENITFTNNPLCPHIMF